MSIFVAGLQVGEARRLLVQSLEAGGQVEAARKAQLLLAQLLQAEPAQLPLHLAQVLSEAQAERLAGQLARLLAGEPLQYILGMAGFMGLDLAVGPGVLIPRPDTEIMAERALALLKEREAPVLADICTGSGALAVSLAYYLPQAAVYATDSSPQALAYAHQNAAALAVAGRCRFLEGDLLQPLRQQGLRFDLIISNPPYVTAAELAELPQDVRQEPVLALFGGEDGLDFYRRLAREAGPLLKPDGYLVLEHGAAQQAAVAAILAQAGWQVQEKLADLAARPRAIVAVWG